MYWYILFTMCNYPVMSVGIEQKEPEKLGIQILDTALIDPTTMKDLPWARKFELTKLTGMDWVGKLCKKES